MKSSKIFSFLLITIVLVLVGVYFFQSNNEENMDQNPNAGEVTDESAEQVMIEAGTYVVSSSESEIAWMGAKRIGGKHTGAVALSEGELIFNESSLVSEGFVVIDMTSISLAEGDTGGQQLLDHLVSDDFFSTEEYPTARLDISSSEWGEVNNMMIDGSLTIKGITQPISMVATPSVQADGGLAFFGEVELDRSLFDVRFGSESFFNDLGDAVIEDNIVVGFRLVAAPEA